MCNSSVSSAPASWVAGAFALAVGGQALAADLPPPVAPPPLPPTTYVPAAAPVYNWGGIYLGINSGYAVGTSFFSDPAIFPGDGPFSMDGFQVGGTIGANYQWGEFVVGIEGDADWTSQGGSVSQSDWIATVRGRAGYGFDRVLLYATGGAAAANREITAGGGYPFSSATQIGWTIGAGVEWAPWQNWTVKVEYLHVDLGNQTCPVTSCGGAVAIAVPLTEEVVRAGINYKFNF
jgi:outer membrane immunogenic protein